MNTAAIPGTATKSLFLVEDESLLRELFSEFIKLMPEVNYLGSCGDGRLAMAECLQLKPDIIILDIRLPEVNGIEMLLLLKKKLQGTRILIFTGAYTVDTVRKALECKADGFVEKANGLGELQTAIETILKGERFFSPNIRNIVRQLEG